MDDPQLDPLLPECARRHLTGDCRASRWILDQIRHLKPSWWQRAAERFQEEFDAPIPPDSKNPINIRFYRANSWLRDTVKTHTTDRGIRQITKN